MENKIIEQNGIEFDLNGFEITKIKSSVSPYNHVSWYTSHQLYISEIPVSNAIRDLFPHIKKSKVSFKLSAHEKQLDAAWYSQQFLLDVENSVLGFDKEFNWRPNSEKPVFAYPPIEPDRETNAINTNSAFVPRWIRDLSRPVDFFNNIDNLLVKNYLQSVTDDTPKFGYGQITSGVFGGMDINIPQEIKDECYEKYYTRLSNRDTDNYTKFQYIKDFINDHPGL